MTPIAVISVAWIAGPFRAGIARRNLVPGSLRAWIGRGLRIHISGGQLAVGEEDHLAVFNPGMVGTDNCPIAVD
jgi:hypothetical protein